MHWQQFNRFNVPLTQQPLAILPAPAGYLAGVYSVRQRHPRTDAPGFKVCSTIRHFSPTGHRRLCGSLLTTARSKVSIYSPSGHSRRCPLRAIFHTHPHLVEMYRPNAYESGTKSLLKTRPEENHANDGMDRLPARGTPGALKMERSYRIGEGTNELISLGGPPRKPASDLKQHSRVPAYSPVGHFPPTP
jgi:hypothetical protein